MRDKYDVVVLGSGPNGLAAAITMAQAGRSVLVLEARETIGGGARTEELTLPGFFHDVCSSVYPMALMSRFFRTLPLEKYGLEWVQPALPLAHPMDDGTAVILDRSIEKTAANLGRDGARYSELMTALVESWPNLEPFLLGPPSLPRHPLLAAKFGLRAMRSASHVARSVFREERARALFAGIAAHSILPLEKMLSAAFGLVLGVAAHRTGWPFARGGAAKITDALASHLRSLGGEIRTSTPVESLDQFSPAQVLLCDVTPRQLVKLADSRLPDGFRRKLQRFRYGPGVCKVDWALDGPIPWKAEACAQAGTVHLGGTLAEIEVSERAPWEGHVSEKPFVLIAQPSLFDSTRAPAGKHVGWAYCHVPNGSKADMSQAIEDQVERFAPGFRGRILKRSVRVASSLESYNPNLVGGDITGGAAELGQFFLRPTWRIYRTPARNLYLCSASTPPGGGVHGLCGHFAAKAALSDGS
ncbi:MAG: NAD(P)/FAD-dependent oxidoreductase [Candidatus Acidiferrales bacterium]